MINNTSVRSQTAVDASMSQLLCISDCFMCTCELDTCVVSAVRLLFGWENWLLTDACSGFLYPIVIQLAESDLSKLPAAPHIREPKWQTHYRWSNIVRYKNVSSKIAQTLYIGAWINTSSSLSHNIFTLIFLFLFFFAWNVSFEKLSKHAVSFYWLYCD